MAGAHKSALVLATLLALSAVGSAPAHAAAKDVPAKWEIAAVAFEGDGCAPGTTVAQVSPNREAFTVTYNDYVVDVGAHATSKDRKKCKITVETRVPAGYSYAIATVDYRGFASLEQGASASEKGTYKIQGENEKPVMVHSLSGEFADNFQFTDRFAVDSGAWSKCGKSRKIDIRTELRVTLGSSDPTTTSSIGLDSTNGEFKTTFGLAWKTCTK